MILAGAMHCPGNRLLHKARPWRPSNATLIEFSMDKRVWSVYLLECRGSRVCTGVTPNVQRRLAAHRCGKGAAFTRSNPPQRLLAIKPFRDKRDMRCAWRPR